MLDPARMDDVLRRGGDVATVVNAWKTRDEARRKLQGELDTLRQQRNSANERMAKLAKEKSPDLAAAREEMKALSTKIKDGEAQFATVEAECDLLLLSIPNAPSATVPPGESEADNQILHTWGTKPSFTFEPKAHWDLGPPIGLDFEAGAKITGARFTVLRSAIRG